MNFILQLNDLRLCQMDLRNQACALFARAQMIGHDGEISPVMDLLEALDAEKVRLVDRAVGKSAFPNRQAGQSAPVIPSISCC